jgi:hypothetical protein
MLPSVTGNRFPRRKEEAERDGDDPRLIAIGIRNMFATEWSKPMATNAETGRTTATNFPVTSWADEASQTARQTSQLQMIPRAKAAENVREVFALAMAIAVAALGPTRTPDTETSPTTSRDPKKFPRNETNQLRSSPETVARRARTAAVTSAVFPVNSYPPAVRTSVRPNGRPKRPKRIRCRPGLAAAIWGTAPPTQSARRAPSAM